MDGEHIGLRELHSQTEALAATLAGKGVDRAHPTLLAAPTSLDFIRCYLALLAVRSPVVLANPSATAPELEAQIAAASVSVAITGGQATDTLAGLATGTSVAHWPIAGLDYTTVAAPCRTRTFPARATWPSARSPRGRRARPS